MCVGENVIIIFSTFIFLARHIIISPKKNKTYQSLGFLTFGKINMLEQLLKFTF